MDIKIIENALKRAYLLGQQYWQQADSEYVSQHKKADETGNKFTALLAETLKAIEAAPAVEPVAWGAFYFGGKRTGKLYSHCETEEQIKNYIANVHRSNDSVTLRAAPLYTAPPSLDTETRTLVLALCNKLEDMLRAEWSANDDDKDIIEINIIRERIRS